MQIPFADALLSRLSRRGAGLELIEEIEDEAAESVDAADLLPAEPALLLQRMENRLIRHQLSDPEVLSAEELRKLRYILNFARLADFEPGAAGPGGSRGRGDVSVGAEIAPWRSRVADALYGPLREEPDPITALRTAREALASLEPDQDDQRRVLIERHGNDFSPAELDSEVGYKKLVTVLGCAAAMAWPACSRCVSISSRTPCSAARTANECACRTWPFRSTSWSRVFAGNRIRPCRPDSAVPHWPP